MNEEAEKIDLDGIPATRQQVSRLYFAGLLDRNARLRAFELLYPERLWRLWSSRLLLVLGAIFSLTGIVCFFAANWNNLSGLVKLAGIQAGLVLCLAGTWLYGLERLSGRVLLLGGGVLVGVFLAVFGQVYQTGADAWEIFAQWSALIFGWVFLARFVPLWGLWLVVTNVALGFFLEQSSLVPSILRNGHYAVNKALLYTILNGAVLAGQELAWARGVNRALGQWTRLLLVLAVLTTLVIPVLVSIVNFKEECLPGLFVGIAGGSFFYVLYRYRIRDIWCFSAACLFWTVVVEVGVMRGVVEWVREPLENPGALLFMAVFTIGLFAGTCWQVMKVLQGWSIETGGATAAEKERDG